MGEKSVKFFINLQNERDTTGIIKTLLNHNTGITNAADINSLLKNFFENLSKKNIAKSNSGIIALLSNIQLPIVSIKSLNSYESYLTEENLLASLKNMHNSKMPGNDGFSKGSSFPF